MMPLTPAFLIHAAAGFVGLREEGGANRGLMIELMLRGVGCPPGEPWCAAFVHHVGFWSQFDFESGKTLWPLPPTASCYMLGMHANLNGVLRQDVQPGDVFLIKSPLHQVFAHTGIVVREIARGTTPGNAPWYDCETIEGNTNDDGGREGWGVLRKTRRFYPAAGDRFIRWPDLDSRAKAA